MLRDFWILIDMVQWLLSSQLMVAGGWCLDVNSIATWGLMETGPQVASDDITDITPQKRTDEVP